MSKLVEAERLTKFLKRILLEPDTEGGCGARSGLGGGGNSATEAGCQANPSVAHY